MIRNKRTAITLTPICSVAASLSFGSWSPAIAEEDDPVTTTEGVKTGDEKLAVDPKVQNSGISPEVFAGIAAIREFGPSAHPDVYAGIATNDPESNDLLVIYLTTDDPGIQEEFRKASEVPPEKLRFEKSLRTESEFQALNERIGSDYNSLREAGIAISGWGVGSGFVEEVYIDQSVETSLSRNEAASAISERYGEGIRLVYDAPVGGDAGRTNDSSPWYGGNFIANGGTGCTNSFAVRWIGHTNRYLLTAGHCGSLTQSFYNKIAPPVNIGRVN